VGLFGRPGCVVSSMLCGSVQPLVRLWMSRASDSLFHDQKALVVRNLFVDRPITAPRRSRPTWVSYLNVVFEA
jgi:hypothetical protein